GSRVALRGVPPEQAERVPLDAEHQPLGADGQSDAPPRQPDGADPARRELDRQQLYGPAAAPLAADQHRALVTPHPAAPSLHEHVVERALLDGGLLGPPGGAAVLGAEDHRADADRPAALRVADVHPEERALDPRALLVERPAAVLARHDDAELAHHPEVIRI